MSKAAFSCHTTSVREPRSAVRIALVGAPNVGKSALFNRLTGAYVAVSNYPGTSVEVVHGAMRMSDAQVLDTPGLYSLLPTTEEERVTQRIVLSGGCDVLVHVVDMKSLPRMLPMTLQLLEVGRPVVLALNMADEAERIGLSVASAALSERLGIEVVAVSAVHDRGIPELLHAINRARSVPRLPVYENGVGEAMGNVRARLRGVYRVDPTALVSLLLQGDAETVALIQAAEPDAGADALRAAETAIVHFGGPAPYRIAVERQRMADRLLVDVVDRDDNGRIALRDRIGDWLATPLIGFPILLVILYLGLYKFVGQFGAGTIVDWLETGLFEGHINPLLERIFVGVPWDTVRLLFVGDYGVLTLGLRYAVALILPIVGTFFIFFSLLEDSGYFPRLALLIDRGFKRIGLSGRAVIPMVLGFACDTMATMVTRTLETKRERILATVLLALAIPCSAQLGVILGVLSVSPQALVVWGISTFAVFIIVGVVGAKLLPGSPASFHMEIPPLRMPRLRNVLIKTYSRMHWYFLEVLPLFLLASVFLWLGDLTGGFQWLVARLAPVVNALGLPDDAGGMFLFGFFRRDYGAAGLFEMSRLGLLNVRQLTVAAVTLTLFVPCIAQFLMMIRERGAWFALGVLAFVTPFAFGTGYVLNVLLKAVGW
ncbi:MAG TPA: ferrous iron transport protein B [Longimicrobiales bacterium]